MRQEGNDVTQPAAPRHYLVIQIIHNFYLDIFVARRAEADAVLLVDIRGLEVAEALPQELVVLLLVEPDLDVVFVDLVAEEEGLLAAVHGPGGLRQPAYRQVTLGLCKRGSCKYFSHGSSANISNCQEERNLTNIECKWGKVSHVCFLVEELRLN